MTSIKVEGLTKSYGKFQALRNVSIEISSGEFAVILGPSGSGKTTLLRCIAGLETPNAGHIYIDDKAVDDLEPQKRDISMIFQNYALFPHMTVKGNIGFPLKMRAKSQSVIDGRTKEVSGLLGIGRLLDKKPGNLSGGEQQRVAIARAIIREPHVFLMDEPLSNLDPLLRSSMRTELRRIQSQLGITTVFVTHDQLEATSLATVMGVMNEGELIQYGRPEMLHDHPTNLFVARFVGNPPANVLEATYTNAPISPYLELAGTNPPAAIRISTNVDAMKENSNIFVAIRPEDIGVLRVNEGLPGLLEGRVVLSEPAGPSQLLTLEVANVSLRAFASTQLKLTTGDKVGVRIPQEKLRLFDASTGRPLQAH